MNVVSYYLLQEIITLVGKSFKMTILQNIATVIESEVG